MLLKIEPPLASTDAYTVVGEFFAYAASTRTKEPPGSPVAKVHDAPPSLETYALPEYPVAIALVESIGWNATPVISVACVLVHDTPASIERKIPERVAARMTAPSGDIASLLTYHQFEFAVDANWLQVVPLSVLMNTPAPRMPSVL